MRLRSWVLLIVLVVTVLALPVAAAPAGPREPQTNLLTRRAVAASLGVDSAPPLQACNPADLTTGFAFEDVTRATIPGFAGQVFAGTLHNLCNTGVEGLAASATVFDSAKNPIGTTYFHPEFGFIPAGARSPFQFIVPPGESTVAGMGFAVLRYTLGGASEPLLEPSQGAVSTGSAGSTVQYEVTNSGGGAAALPRIAGRMLGRGCTTPFTSEYLTDGGQLAPGGHVSGTLLIPDSCAGVPEVRAGSEPSPVVGLPPGLSINKAVVSYSGTRLDLVANVCDNSSTSVDRPQLVVQFKDGVGVLLQTISVTGFYPAGACAPLIASIPGAKPGLVFDRLVSAAQVALDPHQNAERGAPDLASYLFKKYEHQFDEIPWWQFLPSAGSSIGEPVPFDAPAPSGPMPSMPGSSDSVTLGDNDGQTAARPPFLISLVYNQNDVAIPSSAYEVQLVGEDESGGPVVGIVIANPPALAPRNWGVAITPLTYDTVIGPHDVTFRIPALGFVP